MIAQRAGDIMAGGAGIDVERLAIGDQLGVRIVRMGLGVTSGGAGGAAASTGLTPGLSS